MADFFAGCENLEELNLTGVTAPKLTEFYGVFSRCKKVKYLDCSGFNLAEVTSL